MHRERIAPLILILVFVAAAGIARADKIDDYVKAEMKSQRIPAVSIAVIRDGKIVKVEGYGMANVELEIPAKPESVFKIGSVSKQFLATGIMLLVQDGKINLDDKVSKYLEQTPESWQDITIRHFLTHTSGVLRESPAFAPFKIQSDADVVKAAYPVPLRFAPGEKWEYCNVGYFALAEIIHKVSGQTWGDFLAERVFKPLGMTATCPTNYHTIIPNRANGYDWRQNTLSNAEANIAVRPSGGFLSTVLDMAKWDAALQGETILKKSSLDQMWTPVKLNNGTTQPYGFGWELGTPGSHKLVNHGGSLAGFQSEFDRYVDDKLTIVVLTNSSSARPAAIARGIADIYIPDLIPDAKYDVSGTWAFQTDVAGQKGTPQFVFTLSGNVLGGKYKGQYGEADVSGTVEGDKIQFRFSSNGTNAAYRGTIADTEHMNGEANYGEVGTWTGQRQTTP